MTGRLLRCGFAALLAATLAGCFGAAPPVPKEQYFRLTASSEAAPIGNPLAGIIEVPPLLSEGVLGERPLLFTANGGQKLEQRNYAYWTDPPPAMLRDQLVAYLSRAGIADRVVPSELRIASQYRLQGRILRLEQIAGDSYGGVIALELSLIDKSDDRILVRGQYQSNQQTAGENIDDAVNALNTGLNEILADFVADVAQRS
ncbi:ABC-type uncharacterized transport system auxiliary subunit [Dongia mobilis]|uniref:ABC-type uncharacterized transport system auxiliary subunit n=1 Tax=Dongia mobilis TaxID=578943 RepID=A0A4R6WVC4_9PROT|nr:ABC-type transport auxiliary lipoprotein family protein [Dongia mobilis]TDQ83256.1 ABC-type uncharacterized transport system auxiliary subunit [Dongia mobilis]